MTATGTDPKRLSFHAIFVQTSAFLFKSVSQPLDSDPRVFTICSCLSSWGLAMTLTLKNAAQEMRDLYGADAERICRLSAERAEKDGIAEMAQGWREIATEVAKLGSVQMRG